MQRALPIIAAVLLAASASASVAAEVRILTAGAMKAVVLELVPAFEKETGHKAVVDNDTAGGLSKRTVPFSGPPSGRRRVSSWCRSLLAP